MNKETVLEKIKTFSRCELLHPEDVELEGYDIKLEESFGGEGKGDHAHVVLRVSDSTDHMFVKIDGYYSSFSGTDWNYDNAYEAEPYEKVVRVWRKI